MKNFITKAAVWAKNKCSYFVTTCAALFLTTAKCSANNFWEDNADGLITAFDTMGSVYIKWAWFFGIIAMLVWFFRPAGDKIGDAAKKMAIAIVVGYIVFALGGAYVSSSFYTITDWFTN